MATDFTPHYNLDKYTATDKPNLRDQYNAAMDKIDNALLSANTNATEAKNATLNFQEQLDAKATSAQLTTAIGNEATARENADTALGTRITNETSARENADTALQTAINNEATARTSADTALSQRITKLETPSNFVLFGDSWNAFVAESRPNWFYLANIGNVLNTTLKNFAVGGAGYVGGSSQISSQVSRASSEMSAAEKANTKYVVVLAGVNDTADSSLAYSTWLEAIRNVLTQIKTAFPNAKILIAPNACSPKYTNSGLSRFRKMSVWANHLVDDLSWNDKSVVTTDAVTYFWGPYQRSAAVFVSDMLHPNTAGGEAIGKIVLSMLSGGSEYFYTHLNECKSRETLSLASAVSTITLNSVTIAVINGDLEFTGEIASTASGAQEFRINLPERIAEFVQHKFGDMHLGKFYNAWSVNGDKYCWCRLAADGTQLLCRAQGSDTYYFN